jgi:hypothetical protein
MAGFGHLLSLAICERMAGSTVKAVIQLQPVTSSNTEKNRIVFFDKKEHVRSGRWVRNGEHPR